MHQDWPLTGSNPVKGKEYLCFLETDKSVSLVFCPTDLYLEIVTCNPAGQPNHKDPLNYEKQTLHKPKTSIFFS